MLAVTVKEQFEGYSKTQLEGGGSSLPKETNQAPILETIQRDGV